MDTARSTDVSATIGTSARRADAGSVRLGGRDVAGLLLVGEMYGAPYDPSGSAPGCARGPQPSPPLRECWNKTI
jgi:hypothetical protein